MENIFNALLNGEITLISGFFWCLIALVISAIGGAFGGIIVGGKHLGYELAAMFGAFYGPVAAVTGVAIALTLLLFI